MDVLFESVLEYGIIALGAIRVMGIPSLQDRDGLIACIRWLEKQVYAYCIWIVF
jgi:hypothetical protein